ncbi:MAG: DMT family transporter [Anaerolineales bacterium]
MSTQQSQDGQRRHRSAVLQALLVAFLWATSWVLIKIGLREAPPLPFAGLRYSLAFVLLLPWVARRRYAQQLSQLSRRSWLELGALGLLLYSLTQGAQFFALSELPAVTVNLLLSFSTIAVALLAIGLLHERPRALQWVGVLLALLGALLYFWPLVVPAAQAAGYGAAAIGVLSNAGASILGRHINRRETLSPLLVTVVSMGIGSVILLTTGWIAQPLPPLSLRAWAIIGWLAAVNTAFAFTLWNHTLRTLSAVESSIINGTLLIQIPILAVVFLGETINIHQVVGLLVAAVGSLLVQVRRRAKPPQPAR